MKYGFCKNSSCGYKKITDLGRTCDNHKIGENETLG